MTVKNAIDAVYAELKQLLQTIPVYRHTKPLEVKDNEYIVINSLPIGSGILQQCVINVNIHVGDLKGKEGYANTKRLDALSETITSHFFDEVVNGDVYMSFESQNTLAERELKEHFSNIRIKVFILNSL